MLMRSLPGGSAGRLGGLCPVPAVRLALMPVLPGASSASRPAVTWAAAARTRSLTAWMVAAGRARGSVPAQLEMCGKVIAAAPVPRRVATKPLPDLTPPYGSWPGPHLHARQQLPRKPEEALDNKEASICAPIGLSGELVSRHANG
jgi:hypothetical protein